MRLTRLTRWKRMIASVVICNRGNFIHKERKKWYYLRQRILGEAMARE